MSIFITHPPWCKTTYHRNKTWNFGSKIFEDKIWFVRSDFWNSAQGPRYQAILPNFLLWQSSFIRTFCHLYWWLNFCINIICIISFFRIAKKSLKLKRCRKSPYISAPRQNFKNHFKQSNFFPGKSLVSYFPSLYPFFFFEYYTFS